MICIYALVDPRTDVVRYVGQSKHVFQRLYEHLALEAYDPVFKSRWIEELRDLGLKPTLRLLGECPDEDADAEERKAIAAHQTPDLLNWKYPRRDKLRRATGSGMSGQFDTAAPKMNLAAAAMAGKVNIVRHEIPCPVCGKIVATHPQSKTIVYRHKAKGQYCSGGTARSFPTAPTGMLTEAKKSRQREWQSSKETRLAPTEKQKVIAALKAKRERSAASWIEQVKARKAVRA